MKVEAVFHSMNAMLKITSQHINGVKVAFNLLLWNFVFIDGSLNI